MDFQKGMPGKVRIGDDTRFLKLKSLDCFKEVHGRILDGWQVAEVAKMVQEERGEYTDATRGTLTTLLHEYRNSLPKGTLIRQTLPKVLHKAAEEVKAGVNELDELEKLYLMQMERIKIDVGTEKKIGKLFGTTGREIREAREILEARAKLKMDLGLDQRSLGTIEVDARVVADFASHAGEPAVASAYNDPESRRRLLDLARRVRGLGSDVDRVIDALDPEDPEVSGDVAEP